MHKNQAYKYSIKLNVYLTVFYTLSVAVKKQQSNYNDTNLIILSLQTTEENNSADKTMRQSLVLFDASNLTTLCKS